MPLNYQEGLRALNIARKVIKETPSGKKDAKGHVILIFDEVRAALKAEFPQESHSALTVFIWHAMGLSDEELKLFEEASGNTSTGTAFSWTEVREMLNGL